MLYGMSIDEYYNQDCEYARAYRRAFLLKQKSQNQQAWLQGLYVYDALCDVAPILRAFSKATSPEPYPSEPYPITLEDRKEYEEREEKRKQDEAKARMKAWAEKVNATMKKGG